MRITTRRATSALVAAAAALLSVAALAGPADAAALRRPTPAPVATSAPAPAPAPAPAAAPTPIVASGAATHLGDTFSAGGYTRVTYSVKVVTAGTYTVRYTTDIAGSAVNTTVDGVSLQQLIVAAGSPVSTSTLTLSAGVHTIVTQSPDGYGSVGIDLVRAG